MRTLRSILRQTLGAAACTLLLASCYTTHCYVQPLQEDYNNTYKYCTKAAIIDEHGQPSRIEPIADGGEMVVYEKKQDHGKDGAEYAKFYFGADSRCYAVETNRTKMVSERVKSKPTRKSLTWGFVGGGILLIEGIIFILLI